MIPSEFNQDMMAQRRKLRMLNEAPLTTGQIGGPGSVGKKPGQGRSRLTTVKVGVAWNIFRIFGEKVFGDEQEVERMPGVFRSRQAANKAAKEIAAKTGEPLRNEKGRR